MPPLTRWYIKASLLYLVLALVLALGQAANSFWKLPLLSGFGPVYFHLFMVGWVSQLIFGVVFWMFPKYTMQKPRGSESLGWGTFVLLNTGLLLRLVAEPLQVQQASPLWGWLLVVSAMLQWLAGLGFVANTWARVKDK